MEAKVQKRLIDYLRKKGCYVIKTKPGMGTKVGCPDIIALLEGCWLAFEIKAHANSPFQPLQKEVLAKLADWSIARVVHSENIDEVIADLDKIL
jgi:Holliday junction resolvase